MVNKVYEAADFQVIDLKQRSQHLRAGKTYYVEGGAGAVASNSKDGVSWDNAFSNMTQAFAAVDSGDTIVFRGNIREQLTTPAGVFDVTVIGDGNRPRHADSHTGDNGYSSATWKQPASPTASTPLVKVQQQGWKFVNILFSGAPAATASVLLFRDGGSGDSERDGSHAHFLNCRFDGAPVGIQDSGGCAFVRVEGCLFRGATTAAMNAVTGAGIGTLLCWQIVDNIFQDNVSSIILGLSQGTVKNNVLGKFTTSSIVLTGGSYNMVANNVLSGTYSIGGGYAAGASSDEWGGNWNAISGGVTAADPA